MVEGMRPDALAPLLSQRLDPTWKGFPPEHPGIPLGEVGAAGWNLFRGDLGSPVAVLRRERLAHNARWMRAFLAASGASLCPHGKTTMAPQLFHRQLAEGAWGLTLATPQQARVAFAHGVPRVLLANEVVDPPSLRGLGHALDEAAERDLTLFADSPEGVALLDRHWRAARPLQVLVETGVPGGRCGARDRDAALAAARAVKASPRLRLRGVACYEGILASPDADGDRRAVEAWLRELAALACACEAEGLFETEEILLSAGGSAYFDLVVRELGGAGLRAPSRVLLRSGCYLAHDAGHYQRLLARLEGRLDAAWRPEGSLEPALEVWTRVLSRPEPGLAFLDAGKRDLSHDLGLPKPGRWIPEGTHAPEPCPDTWRVTALHDQHAKLELPPDAPLKPGDRVALQVSHPCTTFDRWPLLFEIDAEGAVLGALRTCF